MKPRTINHSMKTTVAVIVLSFALLAHALAGSITITTDSAQDARIVVAVGSIMNLGRNATQAEVKAFLVQYLRQSVQDYERRQNMSTFTPPAIDPN